MTSLAEQLYKALRARQCDCQYQRDKRGVPVWEPPEGGGPVQRVLTRKCARCEAVERYEREAGDGLP